MNLLEIIMGQSARPKFRALLYEALSTRPLETYSEVVFPGSEVPFLVRSAGSLAQEFRPQHLTIVTGVCLFGNGALMARDAGGYEFPCLDPREPLSREIASFKIDSNLSLYELESCARLAAGINALKRATPKPLRLVVNIPCEEYVAHFRKAYVEGKASFQVFECWRNAVTERHATVKEQFRALLDPSIAVEFARPLAPIMELLMCEERGRPYADYLQAMSSDPLWSGLIETGRLTTFADLAHASYVSCYLSAARHTSSLPDGMVVGVENPAEYHIMQRSNELAKTVLGKNHAPLCGLYFHERLLPLTHSPGNQRRSRFEVSHLYFSSLPGNSQGEEIVKQLYDADGSGHERR